MLRIADVTPGLRRLTLTGEQLEAHTTTEGFTQREFVSTGFDDDVRLFFPYPGHDEPVLPIVKDGGVSFPRDPRPLARVYTVRRYDPASRELDIDVVRHGVGVATTWAYRAQPGDRVHVAGPAASSGLPEGFDQLLAAGDDTALPAIARLLDELPETAKALVFIEVAQDEHRPELRELPGVTVTWLVRGDSGAPAGSLLIEAVRAAELPQGRTYAWLAGEQAIVRDLRRHLVEDRGMDKGDIDFTGYWRRGEVVALEEDPAVPDSERNEEAFEKFHEQAEILPPLAIRVAAELGIADHISRGVTDVAGLAERTGANERALGKLLRYLQAIEILVPEGDGYRLSETGEFLTNDYVLDVLHPDGVEARQQLAFNGLAESVRTGRASYASVTGQDFAALRREEWFERKLLDDVAEFAGYIAEPVAGAGVLAGIGSLVIHSNGAGALAAALLQRYPGLRVTLPALPAQAAWLRDDLPRSIPDPARRDRVEIIEQSIFEATPAADAVLFARILDTHRDADAGFILRRAAASLAPGGRIILLENIFDVEELDEHDSEADLLHLTLHGSGHRTQAELDALLADAGLITVATETIGWGDTLHVATLR